MTTENEPKAASTTPAPAPAPKGPQKYIRFKNESWQRGRVLTSADFARIQVEMPDQTWSEDNAWMIPVDDWNKAAIELVLAEPGFELIEN